MTASPAPAPRRRILVTGGTGFLGSHLALRLHELGHEVSILGRQAALAAPLAARGIKVSLGDLADAAFVKAAAAGCEVVMHSGAFSSPWGRYEDFYRANVLGTRAVVAACLQQRVERLIHVSTPTIYMGVGQQVNIPEDIALPRRPVNHYAATKRLAEAEVRRGVDAGLGAIVVRPQAIFGPGDRAIVPRLLRANATSGIPLFGRGDHLIDVTYVDNVVDAMILSMQAAASACGLAYNITNGEPIAFASFLTSVLQQLDIVPRFRRLPLPLARLAATVLETLYERLNLASEPVLTCYSLDVLSTSRTLDISRAQKLLGYAPQVSVAEGSRRFVDWWQAARRAHD